MYTDYQPNFNNNTVLPTQSLQRRESQNQIKVAPNFVYAQDKNLENIASVVSEVRFSNYLKYGNPETKIEYFFKIHPKTHNSLTICMI